MAKVTSTSIKTYAPVKKSRPGVHAKTKTSKLKKSRNYRKLYRGQGK